MKRGQLLLCMLCSFCCAAHAQLKSFACLTTPEEAPDISVTQQVIDPLGKWLWRAGLESRSWSGSLKKFSVGTTTAGTMLIGPAAWDAAEQWPAGSDDRATQRSLWTFDLASGKTVEFRWENLTALQQQKLNQLPGANRSDGLGEQRVNYLRGQRDAEQGNGSGAFRPRKSVLGGILNSTPLLAGQPRESQLYGVNDAGLETIFVAANDGMLHAFSAADGKELFAYVPAFLLPELGRLSSPATPPRSWFDGKLALQEVRLHGASKTILAAAAGTGAKGVVAFDVSRPDEFGKSAGALWEFSDGDDVDMGVVTGKPSIATFQVRAGERRNFVVVSTGQASAGLEGPGRLFLLGLDKPAGARWQVNVNYFKFNTGSTGLSAAALVPDENNTIRFAYAGDLSGIVWRFDFSGGAPWPVARQLFSAMDSRGKLQPIVAKPSVVFAPGGGYLVLFGSGRLLAPEEGLATSDATPYAIQSLYAVHDMALRDQPPVVRQALVARTARKLGRDRYLIEGASFTYGNTTSDRKGWYLDFPDAIHTGERQVYSALADSGLMAFRSLIPAGDGCDRGDGRMYFLDPLDGLSPADVTVTRMHTGGPVAPLLLSSFERSSSRATGGAILSRRMTVLVPGGEGQSIATTPPQSATVALPVQRLGWREVSNWPDRRRTDAQR
ncbi:MAG: type IV pilus assembly protein PilY1 [Bradyrhizobium sp.]|jgi:type IV pilus assembly protein PilY1